MVEVGEEWWREGRGGGGRGGAVEGEEGRWREGRGDGGRGGVMEGGEGCRVWCTI